MTIRQIVACTTGRIPREVAWIPDEPYGPYGIREWDVTVEDILYCVTPTPEVVSYFKERGHGLLVSHHPFVVPEVPQLVFHTALDCCTGGLNDMWRDALGLRNARHIDGTLGWAGEVPSLSFAGLCEMVEAFCGPVRGEAWMDPGGGLIRSVVVCSGLGGYVTDMALATGADAYVTGELLCPASETGFRCVIETGHTPSEAAGARLFAEILPGVGVECAPASLDTYRGETFGANLRLADSGRRRS